MAKYKPRLFYPPLADDFVLVRQVACLSRKNVAMMLHVTQKTVENWESGKTTIPYAAFKLLRIMTNYELPGKEWEGWSIRGGSLFNPSGRQYRSHELFYIGNMFQMARYWIKDREKMAASKQKGTQLSKYPHLRLINGGMGS